MKKKWLGALVAMMLMVGFAACQDEEVPPYLVIEDVDNDVVGIHGKAVVGVTNPAEVPAHVDIPKGVAKIGWEAFAGCTSLESVDIPKSVKKIGYKAFADCKNIAVVTYKGSFKDWCAIDWDSSLIEYAKRIMLSDGTDLKKLTDIAANDLTGVTKIGEYAFAGCTSIESVTIPKSVKEISYGAFASCKNIAMVTYKGSFKDWCAVDWDRSLIRYAKRIMLSDGTDPREVTEITANDLTGVTKIGNAVFAGCTSLASVTIPSSIKEIGEYAFDDCTSIESVEIPKSVKEIGYGAFTGCKNIAVMTYKGSFKDWCAVDWDPTLLRNAKRIMLSDVTDLKKLTEITANDLEGVTKIGGEAFRGCTSLESVEIPKSVTEIGYAFAGCKNIAVVTYRGSFKDWCAVDWDPDLLRNAKRIMLSDGTDLKKLSEIAANDLEGVMKIGSWAFAGCMSLASVNIPDSVTEIGEWAFDGCTSLASVAIPRSVRGIQDAFYGCSPNLKIQYDGTKAQWEAIEGSKPKATVQCSDGIITVK